jgi:hypothetical protein
MLLGHQHRVLSGILTVHLPFRSFDRSSLPFPPPPPVFCLRRCCFLSTDSVSSLSPLSSSSPSMVSCSVASSCCCCSVLLGLFCNITGPVVPVVVLVIVGTTTTKDDGCGDGSDESAACGATAETSSILPSGSPMLMKVGVVGCNRNGLALRSLREGCWLATVFDCFAKGGELHTQYCVFYS